MVKLWSSKSLMQVRILLPLILNCYFFMSLFFNVLYRSFSGWVYELFNWNNKLINNKTNVKLLYGKFFFLKKSFFFDKNNTFTSFLVNTLFNLKFFNNFNSLLSSGFLGLKSIWYHLRFWIIPLTLSLIVFFNFMYVKALPFNKIIFLWTAVFMIFYWLVSGFVFFVKKYQYGKYTSAIQRFWKRSYILFWLLETCLLLVFVYLTFTASQESFYMFDQIQVYKTHLFSWRLFLLKNIPVLVLITLTYFLLLTVKWNTFSKNSIWLLVITFLLTYVIWIEFYQFYHVVNFYGNLNWIYDFDDKVWNLELEARRTRIVNNYVMLLLILRFWHLIFVYIFWLFFVLRGCEIKRLRYPLLAANFQNLIILYIMNWITMYPWFKVTFRKYLNQPYSVFNVNNRVSFYRIFFNDIKLFLLNVFETDLFLLKNYFNKNFFYFIEWNSSFYSQHIRKHYIKNVVVEVLKSNEDNHIKSQNFFNSVFFSWMSVFNFLENTLVFLNLSFLLDLVIFQKNIIFTLSFFIKRFFELLVYAINGTFGFIF